MFSKFMSIFLLLISTQAFALNVPQAASAILFGGFNATDSITATNSVNSSFYGCTYNGSIYKAPSSGRFNVVRVCNRSTTTNTNFQLVTDTGADIVVLGSASALNTGLYSSGTVASFDYQSGGTANTWECEDSQFPVVSLTTNRARVGFQYGTGSLPFALRIYGRESIP